MVKNESSVIQKTLQPFVGTGIQHVVLFDTGSTDGTVEIAQQFFLNNSIDGRIYQEPFIDFATSRNRALQLAEEAFPDATFFLMPDAEWYLHHPDKLVAFCEQEKQRDTPLYSIRTKMGSLDFTTARLFRVSAHIRFKGVVHEVPEIPAPVQVPDFIYFEVNASEKGIEKTKQRWQQDAELLLKAYHDNPSDPRTVFYLAQTYDCLGNLHKAYEFYQLREKLNGWVEENFITLFRLGCVAEQISKTESTVTWSTAMDYFLKAFSIRPHRIEPLIKIADHYWPENIATCYLFSLHAYSIPYPKQDILFVEKEMYDYTRYEIMSRCAWYMGQFELGEQATLMALKIHPEMEHLHTNLKLYQDKICNLKHQTDEVN